MLTVICLPVNGKTKEVGIKNYDSEEVLEALTTLRSQSGVKVRIVSLLGLVRCFYMFSLPFDSVLFSEFCFSGVETRTARGA